VRVNSKPAHDGTDQFFQWLAVDPVTGAANIIFYDRRLDPKNQKTLVAVTLQGADQGDTTTLDETLSEAGNGSGRADWARGRVAARR
jgi:hypothetical protein